jgi:hypothetical protein
LTQYGNIGEVKNSRGAYKGNNRAGRKVSRW